MKASTTLVIVFFSILATPLFSQNRHSTRAPTRSTYTPKQYDGSSTVEMARRLQEAKRRSAEQKCYTLLFKIVNLTQQHKDTEIDIVEPNSSWIKSLYYLNGRPDNDSRDMEWIILSTLDGNDYIFRTNKSIWLNWKNAISHGQHYNEHIRDNYELSLDSACEQMGYW